LRKPFPDGEEVADLAGSALLGEDEYKHQLRELVCDLGIEERVEFRGFCSKVFEELSNVLAPPARKRCRVALPPRGLEALSCCNVLVGTVAEQIVDAYERVLHRGVPNQSGVGGVGGVVVARSESV
jgi:glycosyltransferase involved in cell wall biosynthesis